MDKNYWTAPHEGDAAKQAECRFSAFNSQKVLCAFTVMLGYVAIVEMMFYLVAMID